MFQQKQESAQGGCKQIQRLGAMANRWSNTRNKLDGGDHRLVNKRGSYNQWRGGYKQNGTTKMGIANEISQIIKDKGITSGWDIHVKINHLEQQFRDAKEWLNQQGLVLPVKNASGHQ